jgi:predicted RNase H-like HicB family nuclease
VDQDHSPNVHDDSVRFTAAISHEGPWYVARCLEVEVTSQGDSVDSALANLREALELYFDDQPFPEGIEPPIIAPVDIPA